MIASKLRILAAAGIVGPVLFTVGFLLQPIYRPAYDPIRQVISDLTAGPYGWVQQVNFIVLGLLIIAFALGLRHGVRTPHHGVGPAILGFNGIGLMIGGLFPLRADSAGLVYDPIGVHTVNGAIFFLTIGIVLVLVSRWQRADPSWRGVARYTLGTGIALLILFVVLITLARPTGAPLHDWFGLLQRLAFVIWSTCVVVLATRLRRVAAERSPGKPQTTSTLGT